MLVHEGFFIYYNLKISVFYPKVSAFCIFSRVFGIFIIFVEIAQKYVKFPKNSEKQ
jgi:hypothetical protein